MDIYHYWNKTHPKMNQLEQQPHIDVPHTLVSRMLEFHQTYPGTCNISSLQHQRLPSLL